MEKLTLVRFEEIYEQNRKQFTYHLLEKRNNESHFRIYWDSLYVKLDLYRKYQPEKGVLATYFYYVIRNYFCE